MINNNERLSNLTRLLREMKMSVMAEHLSDIYTNQSNQNLSTLDILEKIITEESDTRSRNKKERYRKAANLSVINARLENLIYSSKRKLKPETIEQLSTNNYILSNNNVIIKGATGTGKSYIAYALINHAIDNGYTGLFFRMTDLLSKFQQADYNNNLDRLLKKISRTDILVIDDFLLTNTTEQEQKYLMEVFEIRSREKSLILCSQMTSVEWHKKLGGGAIADAILDRAVSKSYKIFLEGESLRKIK